jgi:hypothetical protein
MLSVGMETEVVRKFITKWTAFFSLNEELEAELLVIRRYRRYQLFSRICRVCL